MPAVGTNGSAVFELTASAIPRLIEDLEALEKCGFEEGTCVLVKRAIDALRKSKESRPDAIFLNRVSPDWEDLYQAYDEWNSKGTQSDVAATRWRRERIEALRSIRFRVARQRNASVADVTDGDARLTTDIYSHFVRLVEQQPEMFPRLSPENSPGRLYRANGGRAAGRRRRGRV